MSLDNKVFLGGLGVLLICFVLVQWDLATNNNVLVVTYTWVLWLSFHNRLTKTIAISVGLGLLGCVALGVPLGLLLFAISMILFWHAWI